MGGIQAKYDIVPDLSTFGKAMANGMPISALVGKEKYMKHMPETAYSGTFFGEALSMAAAIATIDKLAKYQIPDVLGTMGDNLRASINHYLARYGIYTISLYGPPQLNRIRFDNKAIQGRFIQEMAKNGVLIIGSHNTCYAMRKPELIRILTAWEATLKAISEGVDLKGEIKGVSLREGSVDTSYGRDR
jgi:glutamate-1-semialdehyde 2,1-aminomutase